MTSFIDLARQRVSIRSYTPDPVPDALLHEILEAGQLAPTACNLQPFQFVVVRERSTLAALAKAYSGDWFKEAPTVIAVCSLPDKAWTRSRFDQRNYADVDAAIAADHMILAAADRGLGSCWVAAFEPSGVRSALNLPRNVEPLVLITLGFPNEEGRPKTRLPLEKLVRYETWKSE